ncbi:unnamed protein product [Ambrosiozyma monospora]|uniref:Unnamed protein product n=1 Tax=Ambrosiozyma monospora TaxID=43982 RepID=A0A9W6YUH4_AMBMO|nr:unnamed protein product [Ambrosiozyma monospora]
MSYGYLDIRASAHKKFGKYLAARQLELPEYAGFFINYKALKKLINKLIANNNPNESLQDKKGSFFFQLERELEKVNSFYLEKEKNLKLRLDILIAKKDKAFKAGRLDNITKNSIAYLSLYDGFKKFSKDLDRLEQFVELNESGFTKVLKKWDKRSKSRTKELYLTTAVNVQPVFHREQIIELSDLVANNLMELEAEAEGDGFVRYEKKDVDSNVSMNGIISVSGTPGPTPIPIPGSGSGSGLSDEQHDSGGAVIGDEMTHHDNVSDELYTDFYEITLQNTNLNKEEQKILLKEWSGSIISKLNDDSKRFTLSKVFMLLISNAQITDDSLVLFYEFFNEYIALDMVDDLNGRTCLHEVSGCKQGRNEILEIVLKNCKESDLKVKDVSGKTCLHYVTENGRDDLLLLILNKLKAVSQDSDAMEDVSLSGTNTNTNNTNNTNNANNNSTNNNTSTNTSTHNNNSTTTLNATESGMSTATEEPSAKSPEFNPVGGENSSVFSTAISSPAFSYTDFTTRRERKTEPPAFLDVMDNESISPLLMAIIHNHASSVKLLLEHGANGFPLQDDLKPKYLPLNVACKSGNYEIVDILLTQFGTPEKAKQQRLLTKSFQSNAEGLLPLHIVASSGHTDLIPLLLQYGADINQVDKLNKWSSLFYGVVRGFAKMTSVLIQYGADFQLKDENGFDPLYYAIWEGNVEVLNVLIESLKQKHQQEKARALFHPKTTLEPRLPPPPSLNASNSSGILTPNFELSNVDMIPDFSLPPPIIPLRKYGHNFLEKKIFLKLSFYTSRNSIQLNEDTFLTSIPGRITLTCEKNDLIPRNIMLPVLDNEKSITFQTDTFDDFCVDFELFPTFGTRLIAKATLSSALLRSSFPGSGSKLGGDAEVPLFDVRLRNIGSLKFNYSIVYPYSGIPLEISMYDTYWKSSAAAGGAGAGVGSGFGSGFGAGSGSGSGSGSGGSPAKREGTVKSISFVTASSLSGEYFRIHVCLASDGTPIVCPLWQIDIGSGVMMPISSFSFDQLKCIVYKTDDSYRQYVSLLTKFENLNDLSAINEFDKILSNLYMPLSDFLQLVNVDISLNLEIFFPSTYELKYFDTSGYCVSSHSLLSKCTSKGLKPLTDSILNNFIDLILTDIFCHVRDLRTQSKNRSLILSSDNPNVCTILNWKQPNYPVFYNLNGIKFCNQRHGFYACTANGFPVPKEAERINKVAEIDSSLSQRQNLNIDNIDSINKDSAAYLNGVEFQDQLTRSIKLAINFTTSNNLLGLMVPNQLLSICPELVKSIRSKGLILVAVKESKKHDASKDLHFLKSQQQSQQQNSTLTSSPILTTANPTLLPPGTSLTPLTNNIKDNTDSHINSNEMEMDTDHETNGRSFSGVNLSSSTGVGGLTVLGKLTNDSGVINTDDLSLSLVNEIGGESLGEDIDVNGLRFNDILSFKDTIDM